MRIQSREYDESRAVLTTYLYPHLKGRMTRWLEQNLGCMALSKDEMTAVRQVQRLYHVAWKDTGEIAEELGIPEARVSRYVRYNTHFLGVHDLVPEGYDGDPYERLMPGLLSASAEQAVYRSALSSSGSCSTPCRRRTGTFSARPAACSDTRRRP